jgi:hypothetical protein
VILKSKETNYLNFVVEERLATTDVVGQMYVYLIFAILNFISLDLCRKRCLYLYFVASDSGTTYFKF